MVTTEQRECVCVSVCVCERERESVCVRERVCVCVLEREERDMGRRAEGGDQRHCPHRAEDQARREGERECV